MPKHRKTKIILDTNWYISASINRNSRRKIFDLLTQKDINVYYSKELLQEYMNTISRDKFKKIITPSQVKRFTNFVLLQCTKISIKTLVEKSRDIKDNYLLSMSMDGKIDFLITGDEDLLVLKEFGKTKILTFREFLELIPRY